MSINDGIYYGGLILGTIVGVLAARAAGIHDFIGLIAGLVVGVGLGYIAEKTYSNSKRN